MNDKTLDSVRDVVAIVTAFLNGDTDAAFTVIEMCDDPRAVLAGLAGFTDDTLRQLADANGETRAELAASWVQAATEASLRMERGQPL